MKQSGAAQLACAYRAAHFRLGAENDDSSSSSSGDDDCTEGVCYFNGVRVAQEPFFLAQWSKREVPAAYYTVVPLLVKSQPGRASVPHLKLPSVRVEWHYDERYDFLRWVDTASEVSRASRAHITFSIHEELDLLLTARDQRALLSLLQDSHRMRNNLFRAMLNRCARAFLPGGTYDRVEGEEGGEPVHWRPAGSLDGLDPGQLAEDVRDVQLVGRVCDGETASAEESQEEDTSPTHSVTLGEEDTSSSSNSEEEEEEAGQLPSGRVLVGFGAATAYYLLIEIMVHRSLLGDLLTLWERSERERDYVLVVRAWRPYVHHCLYDGSRDSPFYGTVEAEGTWRDHFHVVVPRHDAPGWAQEVAEYKRREKAHYIETSPGVLSSPPDIDYLLEGDKICFVARDDRGGMMGYVACRLVRVEARALEYTARKRTDPEGGWREPNLAKYVDYLERGVEERAEVGGLWSIFHLGGLSVALEARGTAKGLAPLLCYYALLFVQEAARDLGVVLVTCHSAAPRTREILLSFGFTYYNEMQSLDWLSEAVEARIAALQRGEQPGVGPFRLTRDALMLAIRAHFELYQPHSALARYGVGPSLSAPDAEDLAEWRDMFDLLQASRRAISQRWLKGRRSQTEEAVASLRRSVLGSADTFLFLDGRNATFRAKMEEYRRMVMRQGKVAEREEEEEEGPERKKKRLGGALSFPLSLLRGDTF